ncbi:MAG: hypothetical protein AAGB14_15940, partial [Verrucomicrobiota bacterium]
MRRSGQGHHLAVTVLEFANEPDAAAVAQAAERLGRRHPILHSRLQRSLRGMQAAWHPSQAAAVPLHQHRIDKASDLDRLIDDLLNSDAIDILADGPNLELHLVVLSSGGWFLLVLWPHALLDAVGLDKLIAELGGAEPGDAHGESSTIEGSARDLWQQAHPVIEDMRQFPVHRIRSLHRKDTRPGRNRFQLLRFDHSQSAAIRRKMAETAGELLLLPYFACCASRAVREVIARRHPGEAIPILLSLPVQRRPNPAKRPLFHNHMVAYSLLLTDSELKELGPATKTLYRKYADFIRRKHPAAMEALMRLMERCPSRFYLKPASYYLKGEICSLYHSHTGDFAKGCESLFGQRLA